MRIGCSALKNGKSEFVVWAPLARRVDLLLESSRNPMERAEHGYWRYVTNAGPGERYGFSIDGGPRRPDPASHYQPEGVHGPSEIIDHRFDWSDRGWHRVPLKEAILYELHVGTFTTEGDFVAMRERLDDLHRLGVNMLEIMPIAQFPGNRSWGYDGVDIFAVHNSYGSPHDFKVFVNECHRKEIAVVLDVVYNHFGPEGNYLAEFGPYLTDRYRTPWGAAVNFDGPYSNGVRNFFIENALHWLENYHLDGLRLDAVHGIFDQSAQPFLTELSKEVRRWSRRSGRPALLIAESDLNDSRVVTPCARGGYGLDAQWSDDFHHSVHSLLTGEQDGYYVDFGQVGDMVKALCDGFVYQGEYSRYRKRNHGSCIRKIPPDRLVFFCQNHDQVGNRVTGERLSRLLPFEALKLAAGILLTSPYVPLLFMGEEYGEDRPFLYFVSHADPELIQAVRQGRRDEFQEFLSGREPPDPDSIDTFLASKIEWQKREIGRGRALLAYYARLIRLRNEIGCIPGARKKDFEVRRPELGTVIILRRWAGDSSVLSVCNLGAEQKKITVDLPKGSWVRVVDSDDVAWGGRGPSLPEIIEDNENAFSVRGYGFSLYTGVRDHSNG